MGDVHRAIATIIIMKGMKRAAVECQHSPGVVFGRFQHDKAVHFSKANSLKTHFQFAKRKTAITFIIIKK